MIAEQFEGTGDEFTIEALTDQDRSVRRAVVESAGEHALVPKAINLSRRGKAVERRGDAFFCEDLEAPGASDSHQEGPHQTRNDSQSQALGKTEFAICRHSFDCSEQFMVESSTRCAFGRAMISLQMAEVRFGKEIGIS